METDYKLGKIFGNKVLFHIDSVPQKKGLIYIPNAERRKLPTGVVVKLPEGYGGEVEVGERYWYPADIGFRVDGSHILIEESELMCKVEK